MKTAKDREEFCWAMGADGYTLDFARWLMRQATSYQRLMETACNRNLTEREEKRVASLERAIRLRVTHAAAGHAFDVRFQSDPRGACVKLKLPSGRGNDFAGEGLLCVPA
jgi:hypothetical protein